MHLRSGEGVYYVFILANKQRTRLEISVTGDLNDRLSKLEYEFIKSKAQGDDLTSFCTDLVYWEQHNEAEAALARESEISKWSLKRKSAHISLHNPQWKPLNQEIFADKHSLVFYKLGTPHNKK
jgi:putative endonuclease